MRVAFSSLILSSLLIVPGVGQSQPVGTTRPTGPLRPIPVQPAHEMIIYRDRNFSGPAVNISQEQPNLGLVWTVNSIRVHRGTWELCERTNYRSPCFTVGSTTSNLGHRRVQSARPTRFGPGPGPGPGPGLFWRPLGEAEVQRFGWDHKVIRIRGNQNLAALRLCAERNRIRVHDARARFANGRTQALHAPSQIAGGSCTNPLLLTGGRRNVTSVDVTVSTLALLARGRIRVEGR